MKHGRSFIAFLRWIRSRRNREEIPAPSVETVVLVELTGLGDVIAMLPSVHAFHALFPSAGIHLIVDESYTALLRAGNLPVTVHGVRRPRTPGGMSGALRAVRRLKPTLVCSMSPPRKNAIVALACGAPSVAGYLRYSDTLTPYLCENHIETFGFHCRPGYTYSREPIEERALRICDALGLDSRISRMPLEIAPSVAGSLQRALQSRNIQPEGEYIVIHPFAGWEYREWPAESIAQLTERYLDCDSGSVVFLCSSREAARLAYFQARFAGNTRVRCHASSDLLESGVLIAGAALFMGSDSGPLHLAAALDVPVLGLFGPSAPSLTAPRATAGSIFMYGRTDCSPCTQQVCSRPHASCMRLITVDAVFQAGQAILRECANAEALPYA